MGGTVTIPNGRRARYRRSDPPPTPSRRGRSAATRGDRNRERENIHLTHHPRFPWFFQVLARAFLRRSCVVSSGFAVFGLAGSPPTFSPFFHISRGYLSYSSRYFYLSRSYFSYISWWINSGISWVVLVGFGLAGRVVARLRSRPGVIHRFLGWGCHLNFVWGFGRKELLLLGRV